MAQSSSGTAARLSGPSRGSRVATGTAVWGWWEIGGTLGGGRAGGNGQRNTSDMLNLFGFLGESNRSAVRRRKSWCHHGHFIIGISLTLSYCILPWTGHGERGAKPGEDLWSWTVAPWRIGCAMGAKPFFFRAPRRVGNRKPQKLRNRSGGAATRLPALAVPNFGTNASTWWR